MSSKSSEPGRHRAILAAVDAGGAAAPAPAGQVAYARWPRTAPEALDEGRTLWATAAPEDGRSTSWSTVREHRTAFVGRAAELTALRCMLDSAVACEGSALVIRGEPGIGKSELLRALRVEAELRGMSTLVSSGVEAEDRFPYGALHQLLYPLAGLLERLSPARRRALLGAFRVEEMQEDKFTVALATLELLAEAAAARPVLLLVDDAQWLDELSAAVLGFVARRLGGHRIVAAVAARSGHGEPLGRSGLPERALSRLSPDDAERLLTARAPDLDAGARTHILTHAAGHPLALVELPGTYPSARTLLPGNWSVVPLTERLERTFAGRLRDLPEDARAFLLTFAADTACGLRVVMDAASMIAPEPVTTDAIHHAVDAGIVEYADAGLRFSHPLTRSAIYSTAGLHTRLAAHRALATAMRRRPAQAIWHRAAAALGPDDQLAEELEQLACAASGRQAATVALTALQRAAALASDTERRSALLVRAAELATEVGAHGEARALLDEADPGELSAVGRARLLNVAEVVAFDPHDGDRWITQLTRAAGTASGAGERELTGSLLWRAATRCFFQGASPSARSEIVAQAEALDSVEQDPLALAVLAYASPERCGPDVLDRLERLNGRDFDADGLRFLGSAHLVLGDFPRCVDQLTRAADVCRIQERAGMLARMLGANAYVRIWLGDLDRAHAEAQESHAIARENGEHFTAAATRTNIALVSALRGDQHTAQRQLDHIASSRLVPGMRYILAGARHARGLLALLDGRPTEAFEHLAATFDVDQDCYHPVIRWWLAPDLADAAVASGNTAHAQELLADLPALARRLPTPMLLLATSYTAAVLAPEAEEDDRYQEALRGEVGSWSLYRARLHLHHGKRLRRRRRPLDAKEPLRRARNVFDELGLRPWADEARAELRATGEATSRRTLGVGGQLSAQERQIATLAADGLTNRQIAERLYLSHRTVGSHLYRIYPRLGIANRAQLRNALDRAECAGAEESA
ncbi:ATP-binding protein [Pseudonocardia alaniniphila]|uniref:AAA family ATPase n=1 Tax=Pseudonocardia alaniniphila TaxID=75291 RepID=A0ABS9TS56_9PSEU|nr:LuxR family transcriptional regulator [Pseudonocardia alaniniphila]MCH6171393.1 AAA family ATPase [Pseudonocardia alaniniphila]